MNSENDPGSKYFDSETTDRERAIFEGAITLGALYHQFMGTPVRNEKALEGAIKESALAHPYIESAKVQVIKSEKKENTPYSYPELSENMLEITLVAEYRSARAEVELRYIRELEYPLMYIKQVQG